MCPHLNQEMECTDWPLNLGVGFPEASGLCGEEEKTMKISVLLGREKAGDWMPLKVKMHDMTFCT